VLSRRPASQSRSNQHVIATAIFRIRLGRSHRLATAAATLANVLYEKRGAIAYVTVNRPKVLNA
jgi:hypothetical protein